MTELLKMSENDLLEAVIDLAETFKWRVFHVRPGLDRHGRWTTAMSGSDAAGWPDLCMVRERVIWAELKSADGRLTPAQQDWLFALTHANAETHVWRPYQWRDGTIEEVLR
jgi:hypothetical protein